jgi:RNA polymerase sigma-70 factor, ECF subfamily
MTDEEFCTLYEAHAGRLWGFVVRITGDAAVAEEIVQESFMRVFTARRLDSATPEHRRRYLYTVATNLIRRSRRAEASEPLTESMTATEHAPMEDGIDVQNALSALSHTERATLWLAHVEGWSHREIARALGYREGSLRQVAVRAKRRFIEALGVGRREERGDA